VTGLLWSWPDESKIVATRIEYVRSFLLTFSETVSAPAQVEVGIEQSPQGEFPQA
jgi:hypothetical protein